MNFASLQFLIFFPLILLVYHSLRHRAQNVLLLIASYYFYGSWDWRFLGLLWISTVVDYSVADYISKVEDPRRRKLVLAISVITNLGFLGYFKYRNFFIESFVDMVNSFGMGINPQLAAIFIPAGISFYTFQTLSYVIDVYLKKMKPAPDLMTFALYVSYFPQLVAGPIERAERLMPQILAPRSTNGYQVFSGLWLMLLGFVKKVAVADAVAPHADMVFNDPHAHGGAALLGATLLFALQIYCDFSGYSDIARGASRMMGIELMVNFRQPYLARNPSDFWRRWHISLSTFLRDYVYIPLGGNRKGEVRTYGNLMATMLIGGFWHGANWTFIMWGGLHGLYLMGHRLLTGNRPEGRVPGPTFGRTPVEFLTNVAKMLLMFALVCLTWIFFRANSMGDAFYVLSHSFSDFGNGDTANLFRFACFGAAVLLLDVAQETRNSDEPFPVFAPAPVAGVAAAVLLAAIFIFGGSGHAFIYFQF